MSRISNQRKATYYIGMGMMILGFILFISTFFSFGSFMNNSMNDPFQTFNPFGGFFFAKPVIGMILIVVGALIRNIGERGAAGSGLILDPDQAREDLKPFNEAKGGMINDVITNIDALDNITMPHNDSEVKEIIKIKCKNCGSLNDEDAKFCKGCGNPL